MVVDRAPDDQPAGTGEGHFPLPAERGDRFCYAASVTLCLPGAMSEQPSAAVGAAIRPDTFRHLASKAGFGNVQVLDQIQLDAQRFYRLNP